MKTKEELKYSYLEYSPDVTNEIFDEIILKLKDSGFIEFSTNNGYANFSKDGDSKLILSPNFEYYVSDGDIYDRTRLKVSDILGEETKFEVGKWYSFYWNWSSGYDIVVKVSELGEIVRFDNFINITQGSHLDQSFNSIRLAEIENIKELNLEEIQQYLPDDHPDKIIKPNEEFKVGDYVVSLIDTFYGRKKGDLLLITGEDSYIIITTNREGLFNGTITNGEVAESLRKATPEEIALVVKPKSKEFDRNWYVKVNSQEEANKVFGWLESQGEKIEGRIIDTANDQYIRMGLYKDVWRISGNTGGKLQKQLSDIIPDYSKVDRNVYYEVETQEQYNEILDWLESKGEFLHPNSRKLEVINNWKYVVFNLSIPNSWALRGGIPNLPKAEFQFKSKSEKQPIKTGPGLRDQMLDYSGYILSNLSIPDFFSTQNSIAELNQESTKLLSFKEDDVVLFKTNSIKISNEQLIIND